MGGYRAVPATQHDNVEDGQKVEEGGTFILLSTVVVDKSHGVCFQSENGGDLFSLSDTNCLESPLKVLRFIVHT